MKFTIYRASEQDMINGCLRGDRGAQKRLYDTYSPKMYALCNRYLKDPMQAQDALVTAFTRIFEKINQYSGQGSLEGWIKIIVIREALTIIRKNQHFRFEAELETIENLAGFQNESDPFELEYLLHLIQELPQGYRTIFNLYAIEGFSHKEIAEQLHISENTSKSQLSRARVFLQQLLLKHDNIQTTKRNDISTR